MIAAAIAGTLFGAGAMRVTRRARRADPGGVIVCGHTLTADQARFQVDVLSRWFDFIHHDELLDRIARPRTRPFCLLTFDDGKRSNATEVAPVLQQLGVPAVFYVVTGFINEGGSLWFDRQEALVRKLGRTPRGLELETLKHLPLDELHERLDRACRAHGAVPDLESDHVAPMSWDDARRLARHGFTIGSHGVTHAIVTREHDGEAMASIAQSLAEVSAKLGSPCATYAFPNGNYTARLARHALRSGARTVMTTDPLWVDGDSSPWCMPRVQLFGEQTRGLIELKLAVAATGRILTNPDGTGRQYRNQRRAMRVVASSRRAASQAA